MARISKIVSAVWERLVILIPYFGKVAKYFVRPTQRVGAAVFCLNI